MLQVEQTRLEQNGQVTRTVAKDARRMLQCALERHVARLLVDGIASANLVRGRQMPTAVDIRVGQPRGSSASLRDFLTEASTERTAGDAEQSLEEAYQLSHHLIKKFSPAGARVGQDVVVEARYAARRFLKIVLTEAVRAAEKHDRKKVCTGDVEQALSISSRTLM